MSAGDRKEGLGGRERGVVGSRVEFAANERAFALVDLTRARGQMPSRFPLRPGGPKSPSLSLPSHRPLSPPPIIYLGTCICLVLVDSKIALHHGETEDRHTTHNGPSFDLSEPPSLSRLLGSAFLMPLCICSSVKMKLTCFAERPNAVCYLSKGK
jgi:hypothetical protein